MNIQIYNLNRDFSDAALRRLFTAFGIVYSAEVMRDKLNGRSKCNGVIEMPVENEAKQAIASLDQTIVDGKKIVVSEMRFSPKW
jgi:RNA recognition motif-containing protein